MACWQIKGVLLLASALVATGLAASTAGAGSVPPTDAAALARTCSSATAARQPEVATAINPSSCWYVG